MPDLLPSLVSRWPIIVVIVAAIGATGFAASPRGAEPAAAAAPAAEEVELDLPPMATAPAVDVAVTDLDVALAAEGPVVDALERAAAAHDLDPALLKAVAWVESSFRPDAVSSAGAMGVLQLMPDTVDVAGDLLGRPLDPYDIDDNVDGGAAYLAYLLRITDDDRLALASYHEGWGQVRVQGPSGESEVYVQKVRTARAAFAAQR